MSEKTVPRISSFAAPSEADIAVFEALSADEKRAVQLAELEKGSRGPARKMTAEDIIRQVKARLGNG